jgi:hypothetical protein
MRRRDRRLDTRGQDDKRPIFRYSAGRARRAGAGRILGLDRTAGIHLAIDVNSPGLVHRDAAASRIELEEQVGRAVLSHARGARRALRNAGFPKIGPFGDLRTQTGDHAQRCGSRWIAELPPEAVLAVIYCEPSATAWGWVHAKQDGWRLDRRWAGWAPKRMAEVPG